MKWNKEIILKWEIFGKWYKGRQRNMHAESLNSWETKTSISSTNFIEMSDTREDWRTVVAKVYSSSRSDTWSSKNKWSNARDHVYFSHNALYFLSSTSIERKVFKRTLSAGGSAAAVSSSKTRTATGSADVLRLTGRRQSQGEPDVLWLNGRRQSQAEHDVSKQDFTFVDAGRTAVRSNSSKQRKTGLTTNDIVSSTMYSYCVR